MSAPELHRAARILYQTPLARYLESTAKRQEALAAEVPQTAQPKSPYPSSCARCSEIWVPAVTCRVRVRACKVVPQIHGGRGQNKNKRARRRALERRQKKDARFQEVLRCKKGDKYRAAEVQYLQFDCFACGAESTLSILNPVKPESTKNAQHDAKGKPKSIYTKGGASARQSPSAAGGRGLSLADFML